MVGISLREMQFLSRSERATIGQWRTSMHPLIIQVR
jgi:hypothetical protein